MKYVDSILEKYKLLLSFFIYNQKINIMKIELTADWVFLLNSEIYSDNDCACSVTIFNEFQNSLAELALKDMNVNYICDELYPDNDELMLNPYWEYTFFNHEEIKGFCPELYTAFEESIQFNFKKQQEAENKDDMILKFLEIPRTFEQIHNLLDKEYYQKEIYSYKGWEKDFDKHNKFNMLCTEQLLSVFIDDGLIRLENKKYSLV